jgi:hypothetical protein
MKIKYFCDKNLSEKFSKEHGAPILPFVRHFLKTFVDDVTYQKFREKEFLDLEKKPILNITNDIKDADYILLPIDYSYLIKLPSENFINHYVKLSNEALKPLVITHFGDDFKDINIKNSIILRHSKYRNELKINEFICPPLISSLKSEAIFNPISKNNNLSIGFVGHTYKDVNSILQNFFKVGKRDYLYTILGVFFMKYKYLRSGIFFRQRAVNAFLADSEIFCDFNLRNYWGRGRPMWSKGLSLKVRKEFIENIQRNLYNLSVKGAGNYSFRFFEILSAGRIPVLVDTLCALPYQDKIDYSEFCVIVDHENIKNISTVLKAWHSKKTPDEILKAQLKAMEIYETKLEFKVFMKEFFNNRIKYNVKPS